MSPADEENLGTCHVSCTRELKGLSVRKRTGTRVYTRERRSLACSKTVEHIAHTPSYYECEGRRFEYFDCANEREEVDSRTAIFHDFKPLEVCAMQACVLYGLAEYSGRLFQNNFTTRRGERWCPPRFLRFAGQFRRGFVLRSLVCTLTRSCRNRNRTIYVYGSSENTLYST